MVFSATYGCGACGLRFPRRTTCPSCGTEAVHLGDRRGLTRFRKAAKAARTGPAMARWAPLAEWAPRRPGIVSFVAILIMVPALYALLFAPTMLLKTWIDTETLRLTHEGLSESGLEILGIGLLGLLLFVFTIATTILAKRLEGAAKVARPVRVLAREGGVDGDRVRLEGIARLGSVEIASPMTEESCLLFGLHGRIGDFEIDDADGGDFDVELPTGERVSISLEHAALVGKGTRREVVLSEEHVAPGDEDAVAERAGALASFFEPHGVSVGDVVALEELLVRDGDRVAVTGTMLGGKLIAFKPGTASGRVLAGTEDAPLVVEVL